MRPIKPVKQKIRGREYYRVRANRAKQGIKVDEYFSTRREALEYIRDLERRIEGKGALVENAEGGMTFGELVTWAEGHRDIIRNVNRGEYTEASWRNFMQRNKQLADSAGLADVPLTSMSWELIDRVLTTFAIERSWKSKSRYAAESNLSALLENGLEAGFVARNVVTHDATKRVQGNNPRERVIFRDELDQLIDAANDLADERHTQGAKMLPLFLRMSWQIGNRKSELLKLTWDRVRWIDDDPILGAELVFSAKTTKSKQTRSAFISAETAMLLRAHEQEFRRSGSRRVFPARAGKGEHVVWKIDADFQRARARAGLDQPDEEYGEVLTLHHFRHSFATRLGDAGASIAQIMAGGGWKTMAMANRYTHTQKKQAREAANLLLSA